jgi:hypothetical protein
MMGMDPGMMGGMDPMMMGMDPGMMGQYMEPGQMGMDPMMMGMDPGMMGGMDPGQMGMDPGMMGQYMDPGMMGQYMDPGQMGMDPGMMGQYMDPGQGFFDPYQNNNPENQDPLEQENEIIGYYWGPSYYNDFAAYRDATLHNGIYYLPEENGLYNDPGSAYAAFLAAGGGGGGLGGGSYSYPGQGTYGNSNYRPPFQYGSQAEYDAASAGGYLGYISLSNYETDTAARGEGGGGGVGFETVSEGGDTVYASGSASPIGTMGVSTYDLLGGNDTFGEENLAGNFSGGTSSSDFVDGGNGNDTLYGGGGLDILKGSAGSDELHGNAGDDVLIGGNDIDLIYGGSGTNVLVGGSFTSDAVLMGLSSMQLEDINAATVDDNAADIFAFTTSDFGTSMVGTVIADFNHGEDKLAFSADGGTSWSNTPLASGELVANSDNLGTGETWIFSGTELAGITPGLVLFKVMDDPGLGSITDADFITI